MKVAIVGGSPSSEHLAPYDDPKWEIWVLGNQLDRHLKAKRRITKVFEIHDDLSNQDPKYPEWLGQHNVPLIVGKEFPIKGHGIYPENEVNKILGGEYLSSSPAYMIGYAILIGAKEIGIYGVDMAVDDHEYFKQRPEMYAWIAYAKAKGIKVTIPEESPLFKGTYVEGRDWGKKADTPFSEIGFLEMADIHAKKIEELETHKLQLENLIHTHSGAKQSYERMAKVARAMESGCKVQNLTDSASIRG